jgi:hypothetical protein
MNAPGFWMYETTGVLRPAVEAYLLGGRALTEAEFAALRAYIRQWIFAPMFRGPAVEALRARVDGLTDRAALSRWLDDAMDEGIDPL